MDQILRDTEHTLRVTFYDDDGVPQGLDSDTPPNIVITTAAGVELVASTPADNAEPEDEVYEYTLGPQTALLDLTCTWTGVLDAQTVVVTTYAEVVGQHLFTIAEARDFDKKAMENTSKFTTQDLKDARLEMTNFFQKVTGVPPIVRYFREVHDGNGKQTLRVNLPQVRALLSLSVDGTAVTVGDVDIYRDGRLHQDGTFTLDEQNVIAEYEAGFRVTPQDLKRAALVLTKAMMVGSDILDRAITATDDSGNMFMLRTADSTRERPTGLPFVDAVLNLYREEWVVA